jgi:hypothetical protein
VTVLAALVVPTSSLVNVKLVGETVTGAVPVPVRAIDCGLLEALSVTVSDAVALPKADGVNVTVILQLFPAPSVLGLIGHVPPQT